MKHLDAVVHFATTLAMSNKVSYTIRPVSRRRGGGGILFRPTGPHAKIGSTLGALDGGGGGGGLDFTCRF